MSQHSGLRSSAGLNESVTQSDIFYLTKVSYNESKHEVLVEFSNEKTRIIRRERFFPFTLFSTPIEKEKLQELLVSLGFGGFGLEEENGLLCLKSLSFSNLNKMANALGVYINKRPLVLAPERSFLLRKNWSYFDCFEKVGDLFVKLGPAALTQKGSSKNLPDLGFFLTKEIPFSQALKLSRDDALFLVESAAWSNILSIPLGAIPKDKEGKVELFLENVFFMHGELISFNSAEKVYSPDGFEPLGFGDALSKIDFSLVWAELFSSNFFNIGPETRNCSCCSPLALEAKNLLPSSLIKVRFMEDNLFFESCSQSFALDFHNNNPFKEKRLEKKKEFFLSSYPIGPFFSAGAAQVPLMDAKRLIAEGRATLVSSKDALILETPLPSASQGSPLIPAVGSPHQLNWFCLNKESFFSKEIRKTNGILFGLRKVIDEQEKDLFAQANFSHLYLSSLYRFLAFSLAELPNQLTSPGSKFFSTGLAKSIVSVQEATLARFKEFSEKAGYRVLHANKRAAFVKGFDSLKLAKDFSSQTNLPRPQIASFSQRKSG